MSVQGDGYAPLLNNSNLEEGGAAVRPSRSGSIQIPDPPEEGLTTEEAKNLINIGSGIEKTIDQYAKLVCEIIGVKLKIKYKNKLLIGTPRKLLDCSYAKKSGWKSKTHLKRDILKTYKNFLNKTEIKKIKK